MWQHHPMTLNEYIAKEQLTLSEFARRLDVNRSTVHRWYYGVRQPRMAHLPRIEKATGGKVRARDFFPPEAAE